MTPTELKAWFRGIVEAHGGVPYQNMWERICEEVEKMDTEPRSYVSHPDPRPPSLSRPLDPKYGNTQKPDPRVPTTSGVRGTPSLGQPIMGPAFAQAAAETFFKDPERQSNANRYEYDRVMDSPEAKAMRGEHEITGIPKHTGMVDSFQAVDNQLSGPFQAAQKANPEWGKMAYTSGNRGSSMMTDWGSPALKANRDQMAIDAENFS